MTLECEDTTTSFKFLSSTMTALDSECISYEYYDKNIESILSTGKQKFLTYQHFGSIAPTAQKRSVVVSSLHRICMNSNSKADFKKAKKNLFVELTYLKYPMSILNDAEKRVMKHERYICLPDDPESMVITTPKVPKPHNNHFDNDYYDALEDVES